MRRFLTRHLRPFVHEPITVVEGTLVETEADKYVCRSEADIKLDATKLTRNRCKRTSRRHKIRTRRQRRLHLVKRRR